MKTFLRNNGLSLVMFGLFFVFWGGHSVAGWLQYNDENAEHGEPSVGFGAYLRSGHFIESTFENWESEFLQMAAFVFLSAVLIQRGAAESKDPDGERDEKDERIQPDSPGPVHRGGLVRKLYGRSLGLALLALFVFSFAMHAVGGVRKHNEELQSHGRARIAMGEYLRSSQFWFESFQNWQSEFMSVGALVVLSIWLRQKGSPESKPVPAPHAETGT